MLGMKIELPLRYLICQTCIYPVSCIGLMAFRLAIFKDKRHSHAKRYIWVLRCEEHLWLTVFGTTDYCKVVVNIQIHIFFFSDFV